MEFVKKHFDALALAIVSILLAAVSGWVILQASSFQEAFAEHGSPKPPDNTIASPPLDPIAAAADLLQTPPPWKSHEGSLFASRIYILKDGKLFDPIEGDTPLHPPVENAWLLKFGLDYTQSDILDSDPDGDGFAVLEEYRAQTDPTDPDSVPPYWTKLRLESYRREPFKVRFTGSPDGGKTFTINYVDNPSEPTRFLEIGEELEIAGQIYRLASFTPKTIEEDGIERDVSELLIENKKSGDKMILVNDQIMDSPTSYANFKNLISGQEFEVKKGDTFSVEQAPDTQYILSDISDSRATIKNKTTGSEHVIEKR